MNQQIEIIKVDETNIAKHSFYCYRSKPKSEGYQQKLNWLKERFAEGMEMRLIYIDKRIAGFIEYAPGEVAWRPLNAHNYMVVHCLLLMKKWRGKGFSAQLLDVCIKDAQEKQMDGVVTVVGGQTFLPDKKVFKNSGFETVDRTLQSFELLARRFNNAPPPTFPDNWDERLKRFGSGLTAVYTGQCLYHADGLKNVLDAGRELGVEAQAVELKSSREVQENAPSPYGVFNVVYNGQLLLHRPPEKQDVIKAIESI